MKLTNKTLYADFQPVEAMLSDKEKERITAAAVNYYGNFYGLTFNEFMELTEGRWPFDVSNAPVFGIYYARAFAKFVDDFSKALKGLNLPPTADERAAADGLLAVDFGEAMLVFIREYFALHSYKAAGEITIGELLIAKRDRYNNDKFKRKISEIQIKKMKRK